MSRPSQEKDRKKKNRRAEQKRKLTLYRESDRIAFNAYNAGIYLETDEPLKAIAECRKVLAVSPDNMQALGIYAEALYALKRYKTAAETYSRMSQIDPDEKGNDFNAIGAYLLDGDFETVKLLARKYLAVNSSRDEFGRGIRRMLDDAEKVPGRPAKNAVEPERLVAPVVHEAKTHEVSGAALQPQRTQEVLLEKKNAEFQMHFEDGRLPDVPALRLVSPAGVSLRIRWEHIKMQDNFEELLCVSHLKGVTHFGYQMQTVRKVLRDMRGRVLLADEVGLGKTIEAGMIVKEYILREMIGSMLVLCPPSLVSQWSSELKEKFGIPVHCNVRQAGGAGGKKVWENNFVVASLSTARTQANMEKVCAKNWDMVVVDEAHHLKNRRTRAWELVNSIPKKYLLLLSATPVQNSLIELYNLLTLLKPGVFPPEKDFLRMYCEGSDTRKPKNTGKLRLLMRDVMVRNIRASCGVPFPRRMAATIYVDFSPEERQVYEAVSAIAGILSASGSRMARFSARSILERAGGYLPLVMDSLRSAGQTAAREQMENADRVPEMAESAIRLLASMTQKTGKIKALTELVFAGERQMIVFCRFSSAVMNIAGELRLAGVECSEFHGKMTPEERASSIEEFRSGETKVLVSSESGGEGQNLQFCNAIVNFDLPWNPMRIEQRIGRIHRIGQKNDVFIFNLCYRNSIEEKILSILETKIRMFELVMGEVDTILGRLEDEGGFEEVVLSLWTSHSEKTERDEAFERLGETIVHSRDEYLEACRLDSELFGRDMEA
jgi:superfamily II DNA or RNA helicase